MDLMPGAHLRGERAIYAQKNEDVTFATDKKKQFSPVYLRSNETWVIMSSTPFSVGIKRKKKISTARSIIVRVFAYVIPWRLSSGRSQFSGSGTRINLGCFCAIARIDARRCTRARGLSTE